MPVPTPHRMSWVRELVCIADGITATATDLSLTFFHYFDSDILGLFKLTIVANESAILIIKIISRFLAEFGISLESAICFAAP
ncbi:hypothetical protein E4U34_006923 [Claviceps purpurea]|nr:hypothetical protein E4U11_005627 [Claviceps purpurea]KAG6212996.1 hypothetical protein E4U34_006923 [Claviceps purpurea]